MPLVWLASYALGFRAEADDAWARAHGIVSFQRNGVLEALREIADQEIAVNGEDFVGVVGCFMRATYQKTAIGNLRPHWDRWHTVRDVLPRTPELEAWLSGQEEQPTRP
jgi:hypothetical protein